MLKEFSKLSRKKKKLKVYNIKQEIIKKLKNIENTIINNEEKFFCKETLFTNFHF